MEISHEDDRDAKIPRKTPAVSKATSVSMGKLWSMADKWDVMLMLFGTLGACVRGSNIFANIFLYGRIFRSFGQSTSGPQSAVAIDKFADQILHIGFIYSALSVVFFAGGFIELSCWIYTGERQTAKLRRKYLEAVLTQEVGYFETDGKTAEISNSLTESIADIQTGIGEKIGHGIGFLWAALSSQVVGFFFCWQIALLSLVVVPGVCCAGGLYQRSLFTVSNKSKEESRKADNVVEETVSQVRTVYSYVGETRAVASLAKLLKNCVKLGGAAGLTKGIGLGSTIGTVNLSWALLFYVGGILISRHDIKASNAIVAILCVVYGGLIFTFAVPDIEAFAKARRLAYPLHEILERRPAVNSLKDAKSLNPRAIKGKLELRDVHFVYPSRTDATVLSNFSINIPAGKSMAFVGESGSGKSTIISLLARFYDPTKGKVLLDGHDFKEFNLGNLRSCISLVGQEPALFATSILENIRLGRQDATTDECFEAARVSNAHSFICLLPDKYSTNVGERGTQLSGGQKQRIAIARAVLKNSPILLLDEATSALDTESESIVQKSLDSLMRGRTCVVVAHRLSTIANADAVAVLSAGKIVEKGCPSELLAKGEDSKFYQFKRTQEMKGSSLPTTDETTQRVRSRSQVFNFDSPQSERSFVARQSPFALHSYSPSFMAESHSFDFGSPGRFPTDFTTRAPEDNDNNDNGKDAITTLSAIGSLKLILRFTKPEWKRVLLGWFGSMSNGAVKPALSFLVVSSALTFFKGYPMATVLKRTHQFCMLFMIAALYATLTSIIEHSQLMLAGQIVTKTIRERVFAAVLRNEVGWYDRQENKSGMVTGRLAADGASINTAISSLFSSFINNFSAVLFAIVLGLVLEWRMTLVNSTLIPLFIFSSFLRYRISKGFADVTRQSNEEVTQLATESVSNIRTVYSFTMETHVFDRLTSLSYILLKKAVRRSLLGGLANGAVAFLPIISYTVCIYYIQAGLRNHTLDFASAFSVLMIISNTSINLSELVVLVPTVPAVIKSANSVYESLNRKSDIDPDRQAGARPENLKGAIELKEVQFCYPSRPEVRVLNNVNLRIKAGQTLALVGESGSGKSSIISLIERFYDPTEGQILIDNVDIKTLNLKWLRQRIGLVQQEPTLFDITIRENILYGKEEASEAEIIEAAKAANAHRFISALPDGYSTLVGDRGTKLSGGQKQRVAIARSILKNPSILLLDEATSALDTRSEQIVQAALDGFLATGSRTTIIVAHRLSTIQHADMIVVMSKGKIIEKGNHNTLLLKGGMYSRLLAAH